MHRFGASCEGVALIAMLACGALLLLGLVAGVRWRRLPFTAPDLTTPLTPAEVARRFVWYASITFVAGIGAGITIIGGGGRLAMRLLAATSDRAAQGRLTEADEVVGTITIDGTIGFVVFNGIFGGLIGAVLYLLVRRFLPTSPLGGPRSASRCSWSSEPPSTRCGRRTRTSTSSAPAGSRSSSSQRWRSRSG